MKDGMMGMWLWVGWDSSGGGGSGEEALWVFLSGKGDEVV